jgi:hypothetical protein
MTDAAMLRTDDDGAPASSSKQRNGEPAVVVDAAGTGQAGVGTG